MLEKLIHAFLSIPPYWAIGAVFAFAAAETALFIGFVLPGELAVILGGVLASRTQAPLAGVLIAGVGGAIVGDSAGYFLGLKYGENVSHRRLKKRWAKAQAWIKKKGAPAVFLGRFVAFVRSFIPAAAGVSKMPYRKFLPWNAAGGAIWGAGSAILGYAAGENFERVVKWMGRAGLILFGAVVLAGAGAFLFFKLRRKRRGKK